jgi:hypothetical protein
MTGLTIQETTGATKYSGDIAINGNSRNFRFDHIHIGGTGKQDEWMRVGGHVTGVIDHNAGDENPTNSNGDNYFQAFDPVDDTIGLGDGSWLNGPEFGTLNALYIENNYIKGGAPDDCNFGARFVMRYNTLDSNYVAIQTHGTKSPGGPQRGCIGYEAYNNYFTGSISTPSSGATGAKAGTALLFNNTMPRGYYRFFQASTDRNGGDNANETNNPNGWGYCGTSTPVPSTGGANGTGSNWDGNSPSTTGYPCLDGLGRGQDTQALNGAVFPGRLNSVTGTIAWPHQYLEPIYMWNNSIGSATYTLVTTNATNNQDYYYDSAAQGGSFTGAAGTGYGLHSARPSTCTPGPGGTYGASPTGSYGVAYFATDDNSGNGELWACTGLNTWTGIYQPYTYPHPLVTGGGGSLTSTSISLSSSNPTPPAGGNITLTATLTPSSGPTGTISFYDGGTSIGSATLPSNTYTVAGILSGTHTYTATYSGDSTYNVSASSPVTVMASSIFTIHYTTDGSTPTCSSSTYSAPLSVTTTTTVKAIACASGYSNSAVGSAVYSFGGSGGLTATPTFSPTGGSYTSTQYVSLSDTTSGAVIYFTTDGTIPTTSSRVYSIPLAVTATATIKAMAVAAGLTNSSVASATYTIGGTLTAATPTFSPAAGSYAGTQTVSISDSSPSPTIYYTTDGTTPTTSSTVYSTPLSVTATKTVKAIATSSGYSNSAVGSATYTIGCGLTPYATGNIDYSQLKAGSRQGAGFFVQMAAGGFTTNDLLIYDCNGNDIDSGTLLSSLVTGYPGAGVAVSTGSAWGSSLAAPAGALVGTTATQTLTNKSIDGSEITSGTIAAARLGLTQVIGLVIDGGGSTPATGAKGFIAVPFNCIITGWTMLADVSGSDQITISKGTYASYPTVSSIVASAPPNLSGAQKNTTSTLTGWTTSLNAGDILSFNLDSATTVTRIVLELQVTRN